MHHTITKIKNSSSYKFKLDKKKCIIDVEVFRDILQICPRLPNQEFVIICTNLGETLLQSSTDAFLGNHSVLGSLRFVSKTKEYQVYGALIPAEMTNLKMRKSHAYKTYLAYATGAIPPKKARKFKKPASLSKKKTLVAVEEPAKKPPRNLLLEDSQLVFKSKTLLMCLGQRRRHQQRLKEDSQLVFELLSKAALLEEVRPGRPQGFE
ncbi:hypothetical protein Tco_0226746 [Tanacetum coccineum]